MKKIVLSLCTIVLLTGCTSSPTTTTPIATAVSTPQTAAVPGSTGTSTAGDITFDYVVPDMSGYIWLTDSNPAFQEISLKESIRMFSEKGTGMLYYGYTGCPWCERAVPILNTVAKENLSSVYYIDVHNEVEEADYNELVTYIESTFEKDDNGNPMFQVPFVIAVKDGTITSTHLSLVDSFVIDSDEAQMNDEQKAELASIYQTMFDSLK